MSFDDTVREHLGEDFLFGPYRYETLKLTVRDLLSHRSGLAEGQLDLLGSFVSPSAQVRALRHAVPVHSLREVFDYSNTGFTIAGQVLKAASGTATWCDALRDHILSPLGLNSTFCHRNEIPDAVASAHLASVHKMDPCSKKKSKTHVPPLSVYNFVRTGGPRDFAWGAADAAGSVISSAKDMSLVLKTLLGTEKRFEKLLPSNVLDDMMRGQMIVPPEWIKSCGIVQPSGQRGDAVAAGLGLDISASVALTASQKTRMWRRMETQTCTKHVWVFFLAARQEYCSCQIWGCNGRAIIGIKMGGSRDFARCKHRDGDLNCNAISQCDEF